MSMAIIIIVAIGFFAIGYQSKDYEPGWECKENRRKK
jgi:hypothetical protein